MIGCNWKTNWLLLLPVSSFAPRVWPLCPDPIPLSVKTEGLYRSGMEPDYLKDVLLIAFKI